MQKNNLLVSIFCPTYNHSKYIEQCLNGIVMQKTNFQFEVIVQDDASTDNSQKIIKEFAEKYNFIVPVLHTKNIYSKGGDLNEYFFRNASGKYIAICEGDDYWTDPYKLQKQVDFLEANPDYGMVYTSFDIFNEVTKKRTYSDLNATKEFKSGYIFEDLLKQCFIGTLTVVARKECLMDAFKSFNTDNTRWKMGDYPLWLEISSKYKIGYINESTAIYRITPKSLSNHYDYIKFLEFTLSAFDVRRYFIQKYSCSEETWKIIYLKNYKRILEYCYLNPKNKLYDEIELLNAFKNFKKENSGIGFRYYLYYIGARYSIFKSILNVILELYYKEEIRNNENIDKL